MILEFKVNNPENEKVLEDTVQAAYEFEKDETIYQMLVNTIGNVSYHSGLDSRIPS